MNTAQLIALDLVMSVGFFFGLYLLGRLFIPELAENDVLFSSPKLGRIKARRRSGRIICYIGNLVGKGKHVNKITGKIEDGEINPTGFWWKFFGVHFIGLDEIYTYKIAIEAVVDNNGQLIYTEKDASSIYLDGSYPLTVALVTKDGIRLRVKFQLKTSTVDSAKALSLPISWTIPVFTTVMGASRDYFGTRDVETLISAQNERNTAAAGTNNAESSSFAGLILSLNTPKVGNISLEEICGQHINAINVVDIDFADADTKRAFSAPFIAHQEAQKQVKEANAYAEAIKIRSEADKLAATNVAQAIALTGDAEAQVYGKKHESLGSDSKAAAQVITAEKHSTMRNLTTLVNGGNPGITIPTNNRREEK